MKTKRTSSPWAATLVAVLAAMTLSAQIPPPAPTFPLPVAVVPVGIKPSGITPVGVRPAGIALGSQPLAVPNSAVVLPPPPLLPAPRLDPPSAPQPSVGDLPATIDSTAPVLYFSHPIVPIQSTNLQHL